jgi:HAMP domain-containing protein
MKSNQRTTGFLTLCSVAILFVACANQMEPAKNALDNINATLNSVSADAQKYVPDQFAEAQGKVAGLAASYERKDYSAVVAGAPAVLAEVNGLAGAAAAKKDEMVKALGNEWRSLAASVPQGLSAVQTRIDALSKTKHVPKDLDLVAAKSGLADATSAWEKAQEAFKSGNPADAVTAAKDAQGKLASAATALKLNLT